MARTGLFDDTPAWGRKTVSIQVSQEVYDALAEKAKSEYRTVANYVLAGVLRSLEADE